MTSSGKPWFLLCIWSPHSSPSLSLIPFSLFSNNTTTTTRAPKLKHPKPNKSGTPTYMASLLPTIPSSSSSSSSSSSRQQNNNTSSIPLPHINLVRFWHKTQKIIEDWSWRFSRNQSFRRISFPSDTFVGIEMPIAVKKEEDALRRSSNSLSFKKLVPKVLRSTSMKNLFKSKKPRAPAEIVRETRELLLYVHSGPDAANSKRDEKVQFLFSCLHVWFIYVGYGLPKIVYVLGWWNAISI